MTRPLREITNGSRTNLDNLGLQLSGHAFRNMVARTRVITFWNPWYAPLRISVTETWMASIWEQAGYLFPQSLHEFQGRLSRARFFLEAQ